MIETRVTATPVAVLVTVVGEIDLATKEALERSVEAVGSEHSGPVVMDLRPVLFLALAGIRILDAFREQLRAQGRALMIVPPRGTAGVVLEFHPPGRPFITFPDVASAWGVATAERELPLAIMRSVDGTNRLLADHPWRVPSAPLTGTQADPALPLDRGSGPPPSSIGEPDADGGSLVGDSDDFEPPSEHFDSLRSRRQPDVPGRDGAEHHTVCDADTVVRNLDDQRTILVTRGYGGVRNPRVFGDVRQQFSDQR